jgi:hypothetical protein
MAPLVTALDQCALLDLLGECKLTDVTDRIRAATGLYIMN